MLKIFFEKLNSIEKKKKVRFNRIIKIYIIQSENFYKRIKNE